MNCAITGESGERDKGRNDENDWVSTFATATTSSFFILLQFYKQKVIKP